MVRFLVLLENYSELIAGFKEDTQYSCLMHLSNRKKAHLFTDLWDETLQEMPGAEKILLSSIQDEINRRTSTKYFSYGDFFDLTNFPQLGVTDLFILLKRMI